MGKQCRKKAYPDRTAAVAALIWMKKNQGRELRSYHCPKCKKWHLAENRQSKLMRLQRLIDSVAKG